MRCTLTFLLLASCFTVVGQCDANFDFDGAPWGVSPDPALGESFEIGAVNAPYEDVLHLKIPVNANAIDETLNFPLDSVQVFQDFIDASGTYLGVVFVDTATQEQFFADELGLQVAFNNNGSSPIPYSFLPGGQYCASITGEPTRAGLYSVKLDVVVYVNLIGTSLAYPFLFENFTLFVSDGLLGCTDVNACNFNPAASDNDGSCIFVGDACNDANDNTSDDIINENCECVGVEYVDGVENVDWEWSLYPSPAIDDLRLNLSPSLSLERPTLEVKTLTGKVLEAHLLDGSISLDVSSYPAGVYIVTLTNGLAERSSKRFVVTK